MTSEEEISRPEEILEQMYTLSQELVKHVIDEYPDDYKFYTFAMDVSGTMVEFMEEFEAQFVQEESVNDRE